MGLKDNLIDLSSDEDYDLANCGNYDDDDNDNGDKQDVTTPSNLALVTNTSSTYFHHVDAEPIEYTDTFKPEEPATLSIQHELYKGMRFANVLSLRRAMKLYDVRTHQTFWPILPKCGIEDYRWPQYGKGCQ